MKNTWTLCQKLVFFVSYITMSRTIQCKEHVNVIVIRYRNFQCICNVKRHLFLHSNSCVYCFAGVLRLMCYRILSLHLHRLNVDDTRDLDRMETKPFIY